jgi:hypothetical protein
MRRLVSTCDALFSLSHRTTHIHLPSTVDLRYNSYPFWPAGELHPFVKKNRSTDKMVALLNFLL